MNMRATIRLLSVFPLFRLSLCLVSVLELMASVTAECGKYCQKLGDCAVFAVLYLPLLYSFFECCSSSFIWQRL